VPAATEAFTARGEKAALEAAWKVKPVFEPDGLVHENSGLSTGVEEPRAGERGVGGLAAVRNDQTTDQPLNAPVVVIPRTRQK